MKWGRRKTKETSGSEDRPSPPADAAAAEQAGRRGNAAEAASRYEAAVAEAVRQFGPEAVETLAIRHQLAHWTGESGRPEDAVELFARLLADRERLQGPHHADSELARHQMAHWYGRAGRFQEAVNRYEIMRRVAVQQGRPETALSMMCGETALSMMCGPRVIDFGIAQIELLIEPRRGFAGTYAYASPEQLREQPVFTAASDVFSLGTVPVRLALGRSPWGAVPGAQSLGRGDATVVANIRAGTPDLSGLPSSLHDVVRSCLHLDPTRRPTPHEVAEALQPGAADGDLGPLSLSPEAQYLVAAYATMPATRFYETLAHPGDAAEGSAAPTRPLSTGDPTATLTHARKATVTGPRCRAAARHPPVAPPPTLKRGSKRGSARPRTESWPRRATSAAGSWKRHAPSSARPTP